MCIGDFERAERRGDADVRRSPDKVVKVKSLKSSPNKVVKRANPAPRRLTTRIKSLDRVRARQRFVSGFRPTV